MVFYPCTMMGGAGWLGMSFIWLFYVAVTAFVFGLIFWWTQRLLGGGKGRK